MYDKKVFLEAWAEFYLIRHEQAGKVVLNLLNVMFFYQTVLKGLILVGAVLLMRQIRQR